MIIEGRPMASHPSTPSEAYFPTAAWQRTAPAEAGVDAPRLSQAVDAAIAGETKAPRDLVMNQYQNFGREPFGDAIGPIKERGVPTGLVIHRGRIIAEWGDPMAVEMTHSVTKSFLSTVVGIAVDRGMIASVKDPVRDYLGPILVYNPLPGIHKSDRLDRPDLLSLFDTPHNRTITWDDLLRQTSDWEGVLWGKPDWADRPTSDVTDWRTRPRHKAGTFYQYNDVRTNVLALAALNVRAGLENLDSVISGFSA
jgi:CubicO group peptidase (beta-lactamase class C family)